MAVPTLYVRPHLADSLPEVSMSDDDQPSETTDATESTEPSTDATEPSDANTLTLERGSVAANGASTGRRPDPCPHCDTPIALVVSYGPGTHEATPCGCWVSGSLLEGRGTDAE